MTDNFNRKWTHRGKTYDTAASQVLGTKTGTFEDFDDDGGISMVETLYRTKTGDTFIHNVTTRDNGQIEHSMHICRDAGKAWLATLEYSKRNQH